MSIIDGTSIESIINAKVDEQYVLHGYSREKDGETVADPDKMKSRVFELFTQKVVSSKAEKSKNSWTPGELFAATFPKAPGADPTVNIDALSYEDDEVRKVLTRRAWNLTNPARQGFIQKRLGENEDRAKYVLCRSTVMRNLDAIPGAFVTDDANLIMSESLQPQIDSLVKKADNLRQHADMIAERHPELEGRMTRALGLGIDRTVAALPRGSSNGTKRAALGKSTDKADSTDGD